MTDPADLGEIVVVGQRRTSFEQPWPQRPTPFDDGPPRLHDDADGGGSMPQVDSCMFPGTRREWNADAAAAEAKKEFEEKAAELGDDSLHEREFGAMIYERADGSVFLGPITWGEKQGGSVAIDDSDATPSNVVGEIHSHPSPQSEPSAADWERLNIWSNWTGRNFRSYIVSRTPGDANSKFVVRVYDNSSNQSSDTPGPEVNPNAAPCS